MNTEDATQNVKMNFCVLYEPDAEILEPIIFITSDKSKDFDETIAYVNEYMDLTKFLYKNGFISLSLCSFQFYNGSGKKKLTKKSIMKLLKNFGLSYSVPFESSIYNNLQILNTGNHTPEIEIPLNRKYKIPEIGEKVTLYFYTFLEAKFKENEYCTLQVRGDFSDFKNTDSKNLINIEKADFIRVESESNDPNQVVLKTVKLQGDFLRAGDPFSIGVFTYYVDKYEGNRIITEVKSYNYNLPEIINNIPKLQRLTVVVQEDAYDDLIYTSTLIKDQQSVNFKMLINLEEKISIGESIKEGLSQKMIDFSKIEKFEQAAFLKNTIKILDREMEKLKSEPRKFISEKEYRKKYNLSSFF